MKKADIFISIDLDTINHIIQNFDAAVGGDFQEIDMEANQVLWNIRNEVIREMEREEDEKSV